MKIKKKTKKQGILIYLFIVNLFFDSEHLTKNGMVTINRKAKNFKFRYRYIKYVTDVLLYAVLFYLCL